MLCLHVAKITAAKFDFTLNVIHIISIMCSSLAI